jgi:hypothetical protein
VKLWKQFLRKGLVAAVLLLGAIEADAVPPGTGGMGSFGGETRGITRFWGTIVCVNCSLDEARAANPRLHRLYAFDSKRGQVVMNMDEVDERAWWDSIAGLSNVVRMRVPDRVLHGLMAEENLFKKVQITGLLRKTGTFDIGAVSILG